MAKRMLRTDGQKTQIWLRCMDLSATPAAPDSIYEWRSLSHPSNFEDTADPTLLYDGVGVYGDSGRKFTDGTSGTDAEYAAGAADDGSLGGLFAKALAEAESRESKGVGERIPWVDFRLYIEWLSDTTYTVSVRTFGYGLKRNDPEDGMCYDQLDGAHGEWDSGYVLDAADLGSDAVVGDVDWFIKTRILDVIKTAEGI